MEKTIIYGAGSDGLEVMSRLGSENVLAFCERDSSLQGTSIEGIPVIAPEQIKDQPPGAPVRIASRGTYGIMQDLLKVGVDLMRLQAPLLDVINIGLIENLRGWELDRPTLIIGNGASVTEADLKRIEGGKFVTIVFNQFLEKIKAHDFKPTYYFVDNPLYAEQHAAEISELSGFKKLIPDTFTRWIEKDDDTTLFGLDTVEVEGTPQAGDSPLTSFYEGGCPFYTALQWAFFMECGPIHFVGFEPAGELPEFTKKSFALAAEIAKERDVKIFDATRGSTQDVFLRQDLDKVLG